MIQSNYKAWLNACAENEEYPYMLDSKNGYGLFELKVIDNPDYNSYNHYHTSFHVWDITNDKWVFSTTNYKEAYNKYRDLTIQNINGR